MTTVYLLLFYYELCLGRNKYGKQHKYQQSHTDTTVLSYLQDDLTSQIKRMNSTRNAKQVNNASYQTHYVKWSYFTQPISNLNSESGDNYTKFTHSCQPALTGQKRRAVMGKLSRI